MNRSSFRLTGNIDSQYLSMFQVFSFFVIACFLLYQVDEIQAQTQQKTALCALQTSFNFPRLNGWSENNNCSDIGLLWNDNDVRLQNWEGVIWNQTANGTWKVIEIRLSRYLKINFFSFSFFLFSFLSDYRFLNFYCTSPFTLSLFNIFQLL